MTHRPYPNRGRALNQLARHIDEVGPAHAPRPLTAWEATAVGMVISATEALRPMSESLAAAMRSGAYVLSTRRSGVVSVLR